MRESIKYPNKQIRDERDKNGRGKKGKKELESGETQNNANIGNITKIKPGLTWLIARGSAGVPGETS